MADLDDVCSLINNSNEGYTIGDEDVQLMLEEVTSKKDFEEEIFHQKKKPSSKTIKRYKSYAAVATKSTITTKAGTKTEVRETAENSIRSTASFLVTTAAMMFQLGDLQPGRSKVTDATTGAQ